MGWLGQGTARISFWKIWSDLRDMRRLGPFTRNHKSACVSGPWSTPRSWEGCCARPKYML
jgi:hypothetical protein